MQGEKNMRYMEKFFCLTFMLWIGFAFSSWCQESNLADILLNAEKANQLIPVLSRIFPDLDVDMAYRIQKAYVEKKLAHDLLSGYKAGLTSENAQQKFGVTMPVAGILYESGKLNNKAIVNRDKFHNLMVETEIGLVLGKPLKEPVTDLPTLRKAIKAVMPVIELPDLGFADMADVSGADIIAANVSSRQFIIGPFQSVENTDLNAIAVKLSLNNRQIGQGKGVDALRNQWQAALWLVNRMIEQGWALEPGHILLTGALGAMIPGQPGKYVADYGRFGKIEFEIK